MPNLSFDFGMPVPILLPNALSAQNQSASTIAVILGGTAIPLSTINYNSGFTPNTGDTQFTVVNAGIYEISYQINVTAAALLSATVYHNGVAVPGLEQIAAISLSNYSCKTIMPLIAGDTLELMIYGLIGTAVLTSGVGASLTIKQIA